MYNALMHIATGIVIALLIYLGYEYTFGCSRGLHPLLALSGICSMVVIDICATHPKSL